MDKLFIESSYRFPKVNFDPEKNIYEISGHSLPENANKTYEIVLEWIDDNIGKIKNKIELNFKLDYINSISAKMIIVILKKLEKFYQSGTNISINWLYDNDDYDIKEEGELYSTCTKLPFKLISIDEED